MERDNNDLLYGYNNQNIEIDPVSIRKLSAKICFRKIVLTTQHT